VAASDWLGMSSSCRPANRGKFLIPGATEASREWGADRPSSRPESPSITVSESESLPRSDVSTLADVFAASDTPWERRGRDREEERRGDWMGERMRYRPDEFISSARRGWRAGWLAGLRLARRGGRIGLVALRTGRESVGGKRTAWSWGIECGR